MGRALSKTHVEPTWICDPGDDRCVRPVSPTFLPGISVKHSPSCTGQICNLFSCDGGNWRVTNRGTLDRSEWIKGWIMTQLLTRGFVDCPEHPLNKRGGGWWADSYRALSGYNGFSSGSKLWALQFSRGGATNELLLRARQYAAEALAPLMSWGVVSRLEINALWLARGALQGRKDRADPIGAAIHLQILIVGPGVRNQFTLEGSQQPDSYWLWSEYMPPYAITQPTGRLYNKVRR